MGKGKKKTPRNKQHSDALGHIGIPFAMMVAQHPAASEWRDAEAALRRAERNYREFVDGEFRKLEACDPCDDLSLQWLSLNQEVRTARNKLREAKTKFLLDSGHRVTAALSEKSEVNDVHPSILRTIVNVNPEKGTMSDAVGKRQYECVEFVPTGSSTKNSGGRPPEYPWNAIFDEVLAKAVKNGLPDGLTALYAQIIDAAKVVDPNSKNVLAGGPDPSPIENYLLKFPKFRNAINDQ